MSLENTHNSNTNSSDTEEILIYAEFEESVNTDKYKYIHVLGINEPNPIIQMDDTFYTGKYVNPLGTFMFFEEDPSPQSEDPLFDKLPERNLKYIFKTRKYISMENAYITPKEGTDQIPQSQLQQSQDDGISVVNFRTVQEALDTIKNDLVATSSKTHCNTTENKNL